MLLNRKYFIMKKQYFSITLSVLIVITGISSCSKSSNTTTSSQKTVLYQTNFSSDDGKWVVGHINKGGSTYYQNGTYIVVGGNDINTFTYSYIANVFTGSPNDIAVQASIKAINSFGNGGNTGLIWNFESNGQNSASYYVFEISHNGQWGIFQYQLTNSTTNQWAITTIANWAANNAVQQSQYNNLQITQQNGQLQFSINNTQVYKMKATGSNLDQVGLFADVNSELQANSFEADSWQ